VIPDLFLQGYSLKGTGDIPSDKLVFGQVSLYGQDRFEINPRLILTYGMRVDLPFYPVDLPGNPVLEAMDVTFTNPRNGRQVVPDVSSLPPARPLWSPRLGIILDVFNDMSLQVRGGTGIFTGRVPLAWISNQVHFNGVARGGSDSPPGSGGRGEPAVAGIPPGCVVLPSRP
jgi:hypothetical protein